MLATYDHKKTIEKLDKEFGEAWRTWLPETLQSAIESAWVEIKPMHLDRLLAMRNLLVYRGALESVDVFEATVNALNWNEVNHYARIAPSPGQIVFAVRIMRDLLPGSGKLKLSDDVTRYVAKIFNSRGYSYVPDEFWLPDGVQKYIDMYDESTELRLAIKIKWRAMMAGEWFDLEETPVDVQCAKLLAIKKFCDLGGPGTPRSKENALTRLVLR